MNAIKQGLYKHTVIYLVEETGIWWQYFQCDAMDGDDAEDQCMAVHPDADILWINEGDSKAMD